MIGFVWFFKVSSIEHITVVQIQGDQSINDYPKGLLVQVWVQMMHKMDLYKGSFLTLKQKLEIPELHTNDA